MKNILNKDLPTKKIIFSTFEFEVAVIDSSVSLLTIVSQLYVYLTKSHGYFFPKWSNYVFHHTLN